MLMLTMPMPMPCNLDSKVQNATAILSSQPRHKSSDEDGPTSSKYMTGSKKERGNWSTVYEPSIHAHAYINQIPIQV